jgi:oxygen-dependent protoporphyrinogen oxidase
MLDVAIVGVGLSVLGEADELQTRGLSLRVLEAERTSGSVIRAFRALHVKASPRGAFVSLPGGTGELIDALVAALQPGTVACSTQVTEVRRAGTFVVGTPDGSIQARAVILATPAYVTASLLRGVDTGLAGLCDKVPYASTATVAFGYRREQVADPLRGSGFVVPRVERCALLAATWVTSKWPGRAPEGHVLLRAFLGGGRDPQRLERSDEELVADARDELARLLGITGEPLFARLFRWTRQSPQYEVGHLERIAAIDERLSAISGLYVTGSGFHAIGIPDCIADGRETAARAAAFLTRR